MFSRTVTRTRTRSLRVPVLAALALIATVVGGMFAILLVTVHSLDATSKAQRRNTEMTQASLQLERSVVDLETGVRGYMLTDDPKFLEPYNDGRARIGTLTGELTRFSPPTLRPRVNSITRDLHEYVEDYTEPLVHGTRRQTVLAATTEGKQRLDALRRQFADLSAAQRDVTAERRATSQALRARLVNFAAAGALISAALLIMLGLFMNRAVLGPVRRLERAANQVADGDLEMQVPATGPGEIGQLGVAFKPMAAPLLGGKADLAARNAPLSGF